MPLARIILKSHTGVSLHDRFTRFMKQRGAEEAKTDQKIHRQLPRATGILGASNGIRSSDKNRRLALDMERRLEKRDRSRSPRRERPEIRVSSRDRLGGDIRTGDIRGDLRGDLRGEISNRGDVRGEIRVSARDRVKREEPPASTSVRDRIGRRPVKDRIEMPAMSDRLGSRPISERIDQNSVRRNQAQYAKEQEKPRRQNTTPLPRSHMRGGGRGTTGGARTPAPRQEKREVPSMEELDKEMESYMKKSKHGLDNMLDDYMKAGGKKKAPEEPTTMDTNSVVAEAPAPEAPTAEAS